MTREVKSSGCNILQSRDSAQDYVIEFFDTDYWRDKPGFEALSGGRGGSCLIEVDGGKAILRQYLRGGYVGKLLSNQYLWLGKSMTRPWREWRVLQRARELGLPVPEPIAACACRTGFWYRAALITAFLDDTETLTQRLRREKLPSGLWQDLGVLIKRMHGEGIRHADLNSDNILLDSNNGFYLIDFDKARFMNRLDDWQWRPLYRLQRSINKRHGEQPLNFIEDDWQALMDGYQS